MAGVILFSLILNLMCINSLIVEETVIDYNSCLLHLIRQIFKEDDTLCFVSSENYSTFPFSELNNPYVIADIDKPVVLKTNYVRNFIIFTKSNDSLDDELNNLTQSNLWSRSNSRKEKFLVVTYTESIHQIFESLWKRAFVHVVVLVPAHDKRNVVYTSNPFNVGYYCKNISVANIKQQLCPVKLNKLVKVPVTDFGGCRIQFNIDSITWKMENKALQFLFYVSRIYLNRTVEYGNSTRYQLQVVYNENNNYSYNYDKNNGSTKVFFQTDWMWVTAAPVRVFRFETITSLFQKEVWILTGLIFFITIIAWWLTIVLATATNTLSEFCNVFIEVTSLTIRGTISLIPIMPTLRYIFLVYSLYALIVQTAFNTNLIRVLTLPHYSQAIATAKELIGSNTSIYVSMLMYKKVLGNIKSSEIDFSKLKKQLLITDNYWQSLDLIYNFRNAALLIPTVDYSEINEKRKFNTFTDNSILGNVQLVLELPRKYHLLDSINEVVTILTESGIYKKNFDDGYRVSGENTNVEHYRLTFPDKLLGNRSTLGNLQGSSFNVTAYNIKMKYIVTYICILILVKCNSSTLVIEPKPNDNYVNCLLRVIDQIFQANEILCIVTIQNYDMVWLNQLSYQYVVIDVKNPIILEMNYTRNLVVLTEDEESLNTVLRTLQKSSIWSTTTSPRGNFLLVTNATEVSNVFKILWTNGIIDVVILVPSYGSDHSLYMANPYEDGNNCGHRVLRILQQSCNTTLVKLVKMPLSSVSRCKIFFKHISNVLPHKKSVDFLLTELARSLNGTIAYYKNDSSLSGRKYEIVIFEGINNNSDTYDVGKVVYRQNWMYITAESIRIFPFKSIMLLFQKEVWILTIFMFIVVIVTWWLIVTLNISTPGLSQLYHVFIDITSLTICGTISSIPKMKMLRYIFVMYSLYALIIQTAFKTNLIKVLTFPQYSTRITSTQQLFDLNLPIYIFSHVYEIVLYHDDLQDSAYKKLRKRLQTTTNYSQWYGAVQTYRNSVFLLPQVSYSYLKGNDTKHTNIFIDNSILGSIQTVFKTYKGHYFIHNLHETITMLDESGIYQKFFENYHFIRMETDEVEEIVPLNLLHLHFIFTLWIFGLLFAFAAFILEHYYYNYYKNKMHRLEQKTNIH
ncbi:hypothetical protein FQA39_LY00973 [Lamprigera yunnana]|nr:hypothetical protein FQA39_LY00973 [Lamprigera yunnana]